MKRSLMAVALVCALSSVAFAGIIHSTDYVPPPPPPAPAISPMNTLILTIISIVVG
jgi:hypothetical protein